MTTLRLMGMMINFAPFRHSRKSLRVRKTSQSHNAQFDYVDGPNPATVDMLRWCKWSHDFMIYAFVQSNLQDLDLVRRQFLQCGILCSRYLRNQQGSCITVLHPVFFSDDLIGYNESNRPLGFAYSVVGENINIFPKWWYFMVIYQSKKNNTLPSLKLTVCPICPWKMGQHPKGNDRIPSINFQGAFAVSFREGNPKPTKLGLHRSRDKGVFFRKRFSMTPKKGLNICVGDILLMEEIPNNLLGCKKTG